MGFIVFDGGNFRPYESRPVPPRPAVGSIAQVGASKPIKDQAIVDHETGKSHAAVRAYTGQATVSTQRQRARTVAQIMSSPVEILLPDTPVQRAQALCQQRGFRHFPVQTVSGTLTGIVSDRDLLAVPSTQGDTWILRVMTKRVLTASPDTELREAARVMTQERVNALPILDDSSQKVIGIVTTSDLLRCIVNEAPLDLWI